MSTYKSPSTDPSDPINTGIWRLLDPNRYPNTPVERRPIKDGRRVAPALKCTCGTQSVGGLCNSWCDTVAGLSTPRLKELSDTTTTIDAEIQKGLNTNCLTLGQIRACGPNPGMPESVYNWLMENGFDIVKKVPA